ncbi:MAG: UvrD-helicase domain-containing protein [Myxococcales bacterium]|nr:UvrD-helicase domain-containing protein [Myxococcales bacterium]
MATTSFVSDPLLADLNSPQREAVLHGEGPLLVLAGAGSGKTRVITRRVAHLVSRRSVAPWRVLAVTFTNKAAGEMRDRLSTLLGPEAVDLVVSTFHSSAAMVLRREAEAAGLSRSFVIYDEGDQMQLVRRAIRESGVDPSAVNARDVLWRIDVEKNAGRTPDQVRVPPHQSRLAQTVAVYRKYQQLLRAANAVDFGDLLLLLVELFRRDEATREKYRRRFEHVLVDEFQDTNAVQYELLKLLAPPGANLVVVGDDDQSIYRWRGAEVGNILGFRDQYPTAKVVTLEQNYRSDQTILDAAHAVISRNERRMPKKLWTARPRGELLDLLISRDERGEAQEVARRIQDLRREGIADYHGVAVFYRTNAQSRVLEEALRLARIPYAVVSGRSFYERAEVKDACAYLRLMVNPRSDADLLRVINTPPRGIGDTTVERLTDYSAAQGVSAYEAIADPERIESLGKAAVRRLKSFRELVDQLCETGRMANDAAGAVERMLLASGMVEAYQIEGTPEATGRAENLRELQGAASEFDLQFAAQPKSKESLSPELPPLQAFLERISLLGEADGEVGEGKVSLMTLHAAKGLEFDMVFITGMEDGVFPHARALDSSAGAEEMAEERRLCYVGFTRARRRLFLSLAQGRALYGELKFNPPSRFLSEVPRELFGFEEEALVQRQVLAVPPRVRRRAEEGEGPVIDRSYDQRTDFDGEAEGARGIRVRHSQFGMGVVVQVDGRGPNAKLTVEFESVGPKRVLARFLEPL